jgi:hypothetical protein
LAQRAFAAAAIFALAAALILRFGPCDFFPLTLAQRALAPAAMRARAAALIFLRFVAGAEFGDDPKTLAIWFWSDSILPLMLASLINWVGDRFIIEFMGIVRISIHGKSRAIWHFRHGDDFDPS